MSTDPAAYAAAPFDHDRADIILRSSDNVDFRVFKLFLSLASPFFETLFDIPQPAEENDEQVTRDGLVVVPVTEDSKTIDALLRFCYPCTLADDPVFESLKDAMDIFEAARKYSLNIIETKARRAIANPKILEVESLRCFAIAHRGRMKEEAVLAAKYTLTQPLVPSWFEEIELISASELLSLLTYHKRCGDAVYALRLNLLWITSYYGSPQACGWYQRTCSCPSINPSKYALVFNGQSSNSWGTLKWWDDFMDDVFMTLRDKPCKETVQASAEKTVQAVKARNCSVCSPRVTERMRDFVDFFVRKVEETISQIELELMF